MIARNIIAIGVSAGGIDALQKVVSGFSADLNAAVFITMHLYERSEGLLPEILSRAGPLPASHPWEETTIEMGKIYVAPPDHHLLLTDHSVYVGHGPKENLQRPCINTMFRSAATAFGDRVAGVVLTGMLDDGSAGLWEIQQRGGATVVQDPEEAAYRSMPESAIRGLSVQYIVRLAEMGPLFSRLAMGDQQWSDQSARAEVEVAHEVVDDRVSQACPECGGVMKVHRLGRLVEYTCHVGHRIGLKTMIAEKSGNVERAIWTALSQSEELVDLLMQAQPNVEPEASAALVNEIDERRNEQDSLRTLTERTKTIPYGTGQATS